MPLLTEQEWCISYRHENGDLIDLFNPALLCVVQYDRMTGYFSADVLALASRGIQQLIGDDGRMRLIVGCTLQQQGQDAIGEGYHLRERLEAQLLSRSHSDAEEFPILPANEQTLAHHRFPQAIQPNRNLRSRLARNESPTPTATIRAIHIQA